MKKKIVMKSFSSFVPLRASFQLIEKIIKIQRDQFGSHEKNIRFEFHLFKLLEKEQITPDSKGLRSSPILYKFGI